MPSRPRSSLAVLAAAELFALPRAAHAQLDTLRVTWGLHGAYPEYVAASVGVSTIHTYANGDLRQLWLRAARRGVFPDHRRAGRALFVLIVQAQTPALMRSFDCAALRAAPLRMTAKGPVRPR